MKRALIFDLDNTVYPVNSIADNLFGQLFALIDQNNNGLAYQTIVDAKDELKRRPYHLVAAKFNFGEKLTNKGNELLKNITYNLPMQPFEDYHHLKTVPLDKYLVTTGFSKLQWSKVKMLDIEGDFKEIHIVDLAVSTRTKKDVFADIMARYNYAKEEVLVIGDDPESEIRAAADLGIDTFLFDPDDKHTGAFVTHHSKSLKDVLNIILLSTPSP